MTLMHRENHHTSHAPLRSNISLPVLDVAPLDTLPLDTLHKLEGDLFSHFVENSHDTLPSPRNSLDEEPSSPPVECRSRRISQSFSVSREEEAPEEMSIVIDAPIESIETDTTLAQKEPLLDAVHLMPPMLTNYDALQLEPLEESGSSLGSSDEQGRLSPRQRSLRGRRRSPKGRVTFNTEEKSYLQKMMRRYQNRNVVQFMAISILAFVGGMVASGF